MQGIFSDCVLAKVKQLLTSSGLECATDASLLEAFDKSCSSPIGITATNCYQCACHALSVEGLVNQDVCLGKSSSTTV